MGLDAKAWLFVALGGFAAFYVWMLWRGVRRRELNEPRKAAQPSAPAAATGFVTAFFDTLGIGSFATTTTIFRHFVWSMTRSCQAR